MWKQRFCTIVCWSEVGHTVPSVCLSASEGQMSCCQAAGWMLMNETEPHQCVLFPVVLYCESRPDVLPAAVASGGVWL
ncbi:hypothetical protein PAMP_008636 [Pampus punctatissimus]